ncbi:PH domain-containing protein [Brachybacterium sp. DNPG3]
MSLPEGHRRTHPITPLLTGWRIVVGAVAVITAQNLASLLQDFTLRRALIGTGVLIALAMIGVLVSLVSWRRTSYAVDDDGVALHSGLISRSREFAPRSRIESVSVERPLLARLAGLAKVRIEVAGGSDSHLEIQYVTAEDAERLRRRILRVAAGGEAGAAVGGAVAGSAVAAPSAAGGSPTTTEEGDAAADSPAVAGTAPGAAPLVASSESRAEGLVEALHERLDDDFSEGEPIAEVPVERLLRSLLRDPGFLGGALASAAGVAVAAGFAIARDGFSPAMLIALVPAVIALPKFVLGRIEAGWGFVSRIAPSGLRMRRGLLNTRTDSIAAGRIQMLEVSRPLLWRAPAWTAVSATVAGIDDAEDSGDLSVLPVGTREELALTLGHLAAPLGTDDDLATLEHLLIAPARSIDGWRAPHRVQWIARRTQVTVLLPGAVVRRRGILGRTLEIVPRDRIQQLTLSDGPLARRLGTLDLAVGVGGDSQLLDALPREGAIALHAALAPDAATSRRYRDRASWARPALAAAGPTAGARA